MAGRKDIATLASLFLGVLLCCFHGVDAGEYCYDSSYYSSYSYSTYCTYGCCGYWPNEYCCTVGVGAIAGGVIGGIIFICAIVALVCCCIKKQGHAGRVVQPTTQPGIHVISTNSNNAMYGPGYSGAQPYGGQPYGGQAAYGYGAQPAQPPAYNPAFQQPPPAYNYSDPAYPPGVNPAQPAPAQPAPANQPPRPGFNVK